MNKTAILLLMILLTASNCLSDPGNTIASADAAYDRFDLRKSREILEALLMNDSLKAGTKCQALRRLAHQDWKYYQDHDLAIRRLMKADSLGESRFDTWILISRIQRESLHFEQSMNAALEAEKAASSRNQADRARIEYAHAAYAYSTHLLQKNKPLDLDLLARSADMLSALLDSDAGMPKPSRLLLGISLLNNDGGNVVKAWKSYFHVQSIDKTTPYLEAAARKLSQVCSEWQGKKLEPGQQQLLIEALASSRFYEFIPFYLKANQSAVEDFSQQTRDIITYSEYLQDVKIVTDEYYRTIAIGEHDQDNYIQWLENKRKELWNQLSFPAGKEFSEREFLNETEKHFGARGFTGSTGNYNGYVLCLGHIVDQQKANVEQYGFNPEFIYTRLDMMVSNGFSSWFWEDKAIGGWATDDEIIQIREVYLGGPFGAWRSITDSLQRQNNDATIAEFLNQVHADERKQAEGLAVKLRTDALEGLYLRISSEGLSGQDLKLAFLAEYENYRLQASILAHEGRHSIERKYMPQEFASWDSETREFHAKLSQIIFASEPRLELAGMVNTSGNSGHARADQRIVSVAIDWIKNNHEKVAGYSPQRSAFSQIHLLTAEQLRECYLQADPLNRD